MPKELERAINDFPKVIKLRIKRYQQRQKLIKEKFDPLTSQFRKRCPATSG